MPIFMIFYVKLFRLLNAWPIAVSTGANKCGVFDHLIRLIKVNSS